MDSRQVVCIVLLGLVVVGVGAAAVIILPYNDIISQKLEAENKWSAIQIQFERKIELIPQLVTVVENYTSFEAETLAQLTSLRTQWLILNGSPSEQANVSTQLNLQLNSLFIAVQENYPTLYASALYIGLFDEITGTENRITQAKLDYNDAVTAYNTKIATFPGNLDAGMFGLQPMILYAAS